MNYDELTEYLQTNYPKLFVRESKRSGNCVALECGPGWGNILIALCSNIQSHIDWKRSQRARALQFNRCLKKAIDGDKTGLIRYHTHGVNGPSAWTLQSVAADIDAAKYRVVPDIVHQVTLEQIKEKLGTLRFYYSGGDDDVSGMVRMAESMSAFTCEECGSPGKRRSTRWLRTLCDAHTKVTTDDMSIEP